MNERSVRLASAALALVGAAITSYLLYVRANGSVPLCSGGGCETVQNSRYSEAFGVPIAAFGLAAYVALLATVVARGEAARLGNVVLALGGLAFGVYLFYLQARVIGAFCDWCLASDVVATAMAVLALVRLRVGSTAHGR